MVAWRGKLSANQTISAKRDHKRCCPGVALGTRRTQGANPRQSAPPRASQESVERHQQSHASRESQVNDHFSTERGFSLAALSLNQVHLSLT
jgi:hypothetical protein